MSLHLRPLGVVFGERTIHMGVTIHHATKLPAAIEDEVSIVIRDKTVFIKTTGNKKITLQ